jgi:hypothetical protein
MAGDVSYSMKRVVITLNGKRVTNLRGWDDPDTLEAAPTRIMAGAKNATGFNESDSNMMDYAFTVAPIDGSEYDADLLIDGPIETRAVALVVAYENADGFPDGAFTGVTGTGRLSRQGRRMGDDAGERAYVVHLNGFQRDYKNRPPIVKA